MSYSRKTWYPKGHEIKTPMNPDGVNDFEGRIENGFKDIENRLTGIGGTCQNITGDLDTCCGVKSGFYNGVNLKNAPSTDYYYIIHLVNDENYQLQIAFRLTVVGSRFIRLKYYGKWTEWANL